MEYGLKNVAFYVKKHVEPWPVTPLANSRRIYESRLLRIACDW